MSTIKKLLLTIMVIFMGTPVAHADLTCQGLNDPADTKDLVISIIEEQFGEPTTTGDLVQALRCVRVTTCKEVQQSESGSTQQTTTTECSSEYADSCPSGEGTICQTVQAFFSTSGLDLLFSYISLIYRWAAGVIGVVSVFYLVYGGIKISTAGDNTAAIDEAKAKIIQSIAGLVLLFLSAVILYTINPNFFTL